MREHFGEAADFLAFTVASAPPIPENIVVYRMVCDEFIQKLIEQNKEGLPTAEEGFLSSSLIADISQQEEWYAQNDNMLKIFVPKGTLGIYVNTVASRSECELLIAPNHYLQLIAYPYVDDITKKTVFECELFSFQCFV